MGGAESFKKSFNELVFAFALAGSLVVGWENQSEIMDFIFGTGSPEAHAAAVGDAVPNH